jgi:branched-chain amino acid transport system ATP-binding protein
VYNTPLEVNGLCSGYEDLEVVHNFSMRLNEGQIVCAIGPNGSGKSTLLRTMIGLIKPTEGTILLNGENIAGLKPNEILRKGMCLLPQGRSVFPMMTVLENLKMGAYIINDSKEIKERLIEVYGLFPVLEKRRKSPANKLSGGEQAMLCIARALMTHPKIILFDEPSIGLAPNIINDVYKMIKEINRKGCSMVIVEQNVRQALSFADYAYVLSSGEKKFEGTCEALQKDARIVNLYLGSLKTNNRTRSNE